MDKTFRYLKLLGGYQKGSIFSGFVQQGYWDVNDISPNVVNIQRGQSVTFPVSISRNNYDKDITLQLYNPPSGIDYSFNPPVLTGVSTQSTLTVTAANTMVSGQVLNAIVTGTPSPQKVSQFGININDIPYWNFGTYSLSSVIPRVTGGPTTTFQSTQAPTTPAPTTLAPTTTAAPQYSYPTVNSIELSYSNGAFHIGINYNYWEGLPPEPFLGNIYLEYGDGFTSNIINLNRARDGIYIFVGDVLYNYYEGGTYVVKLYYTHYPQAQTSSPQLPQTGVYTKAITT